MNECLSEEGIQVRMTHAHSARLRKVFHIFTHLREVDNSIDTTAISAVSSLYARRNMDVIFCVVVIILLRVGLSPTVSGER